MRKALGRGLDALIPTSSAPSQELSASSAAPTVLVAIERIRPNHLQPRRNFDPEKLGELAASIKEHGLAQPLLVSVEQGGNGFELIAGERRLRAAQLAGLREVPVYVKDPGSDRERLALALIENLQREDLNPIEEALGYLRLMKEFSISQTDLGQQIGKSKQSISNTLRLLELPDEMQKALEAGQISEGHGRALLMAQNGLARKKLFDIMLAQKISVRDAEELARRANGGESLETERPVKKALEKAADIRNLESALQQLLGTKVEIKTRKDPTKGSITVHFYTLDDFDRILKILKK